MNTWEIYGHDWAVSMLQKHAANDMLRHAYLLTGSAGVGRRTLAIRLAQALNCTAPSAPGVPCRKCRSCIQIEGGRHPDMLVIRKLDEKRDIIIEQIREVSKFLSLKPYMAQYKVVIILNFELANHNSQNALLKTLEEAPDYGLLLLTVDNAEQLLPTIISRCETIRLRPLSWQLVDQFLTARGTDPEKARLLAHLCGGRPGYALQLAADDAMLAFRAEKLDDINHLLSARRRDRFQYAEKLARDKDIFLQVLLVWLSFWRDILLKVSGSSVEIINVDREDEITSLADNMTLPVAHHVTEKLENTIDLLDKNINPKLLAEVTLMDWPRISRVSL